MRRQRRGGRRQRGRYAGWPPEAVQQGVAEAPQPAHANPPAASAHMRDDDDVADADLDRIVRHQAKRYDFAVVNDPVSKLPDFACVLRAGPADELAAIGHRPSPPYELVISVLLG